MLRLPLTARSRVPTYTIMGFLRYDLANRLTPGGQVALKQPIGEKKSGHVQGPIYKVIL